ncbi:hypothetical protein P152DRAFT_269128 [Eremomyces bilateralis CBS 781.70]|uniref:Uncharacterized protein n=1 Tax=Eremomyces bilateralis CBS 781.70 TaxID=1392243 RepID=A0A6G1G8I0_9PEZI|nr:uncharacterized protein P152DRAFT_269128 [Eremomyces bilateralis CBS 781.70]KAF1814377.1 hypothetical protein P152DRAFT_269128 [Eremomyces bilateralis CBS 781.70]
MSARCTGVKACQYLAQDIIDLKHTCFEEDDWEKIRNSRNAYQQSSLTQQANSFYLPIIEAFRKGSACKDIQDENCIPEVYQSSQVTISGVPNFYIRCERHTYGSQHFFRSIPGYLYPRITEIKALFNTTEHDTVVEPCAVLKQMNSRAKRCGKSLLICL